MNVSNDHQSRQYRALIATGGIGSGIFASLRGNHTLGREESREVHFLNRRDYCKGHIISHYVNVLLPSDFRTILIGRIGDDPIGQSLIDEMRQSGLDLRYIRAVPGTETLYSVCILYPDGSGGNLTSGDSASSQVSEADITQAEREFDNFEGSGIALAAPEVPLQARKRLLDLATRHNFLRTGSFISAEIENALVDGLFVLLDLVALNLDEAAVLVGQSTENALPEVIATSAIDQLSRKYPALMVSVTAGKLGSWSWDGQHLHHLEAYPTRVVSTAGAGDAHLAGIIAGLVSGFSLAHAQELGGLTAAVSVTSPHTIAPQVCRQALWNHAQENHLLLSKPVQAFLQNGSNSQPY